MLNFGQCYNGQICSAQFHTALRQSGSEKGEAMAIFRIMQSLTLLGLLAGSAGSVSAARTDAVDLFDVGDNRALVQRANYAYYPANAEFRIRLTLANGQVKSGRFVEAEVIDHLLMILSADIAGERLICVYDGNNILALLAETER
jgi:hypothetical protein